MGNPVMSFGIQVHKHVSTFVLCRCSSFSFSWRPMLSLVLQYRKTRPVVAVQKHLSMLIILNVWWFSLLPLHHVLHTLVLLSLLQLHELLKTFQLLWLSVCHRHHQLLLHLLPQPEGQLSQQKEDSQTRSLPNTQRSAWKNAQLSPKSQKRLVWKSLNPLQALLFHLL